MIAAKKDILQGWKDIAAYVSRDVRTVKRWEKQRGLPVRRMPGDGRANVYALIPELDNWLSSGGTTEAEPEPVLQPETPDSEPLEAETPEPLPTELATFLAAETTHHRHSRRRWLYGVAAFVCVAAVTAVALRGYLRDRDTADVPPFNPTQTMRMVKYSSKIAGVDALYLRGIYFYEQRTPDTLERALKCFNAALAKDPAYAPAYAGLAQTYNLIRQYSTMSDEEAYSKAEAAARKAIALDPNLSEAHASLGFVEFFRDWDAPAAEHEFHTSLDLDPNSALAHHWYGSMLTHQARFSEGLQQLDVAQHLQPTSISILSDRAFNLGMSGNRNEAADLLQEVLNEEPRSPSPHYILATISMVEPRDIPRYLDEMRRFATLRHDPQRLHMLDTLEPAFRTGGANAMWRATLAWEQQIHPSPNDRTYAMVEAEAVLGMREAALHDLEQLAERRDSLIIGMTINPLLLSLHHEPRYITIANKIGLIIPR